MSLTHVSKLLSGTVVLLCAACACLLRAEEMPRPTGPGSLPQRWLYEPQYQQDAEADVNWWHSFGDPTLDTLIARGLANNLDVLTAARRMEIARQTLNQVRSQYFPTLAAEAGWTKSRSAGAIAGKHVKSTDMSYWSVGVDMSWEVDLFGRVSAQARERRSQWQATRAEYAGAQVSMAAGIASAYMQLRVLQAQLLVARTQIAGQDSLLTIARAREEAGLSDGLAVAQSATVYYQTQASVPSLETSIAQTKNALAVLIGVVPAALPAAVDQPHGLPDYHRLVAVGVPADILRRRPDIAAAEATIAADAAAVGIAKKDYLPALRIDGSIGTSAHSAGDLFGSNSLTYEIAPTLSWTIFDGLSRKYGVAIAREQMAADIDSYNLTVLQAVEEVNNALAAYNNALRSIELYEKVCMESYRALKLATNLFKGGLTSYTNVADAQLNLLEYSNSLVSAKGDALSALVNLYKALGGGWTADMLEK